MEHIIKDTAKLLTSLFDLELKLNNKEYWLNKAKEETDLVLLDDAWIYVDVTLLKIEVSVYSNKGSEYNSKYWINGEWFDKPFDVKYPDIKTLL
jgi:hypothetical protein